MQDQTARETLDRLMVDTITHEMIRPLDLLSINRSYLWTHLQCDEDDADEKVKQALDSIGVATSHIERLWRNCADLMACTHGEMQPRQEPVDLCALIQLIGEENEYVERATGVKLEIAIPKQPLCVTTDSTMAERILLNLLSNALQLSKPGKKVIIALKEKADDVQLIVQDFGQGMTKQIVQTLCTAPCVNTQEGEHPYWVETGIGLHLCREMCGLLEWKPTVKTGIKGTTVILNIPRDKVVATSQLVFRSEGEQAELYKAECRARIRMELGSVPGLEKYWT